MQISTAHLSGLWYFAFPSSALKQGRMVRQILLDTAIVFGRTEDNVAFALEDKCPHRAAPLSLGRLTQEKSPCVECPYHGWKFDTQTGQCRSIPAISQNTSFEFEKISVRRFHLHEANGLIWIFNGDDPAAASSAARPQIDLPETQKPNSVTIVDASGPYEEAVIGLIDPAHTPFVHKQWWWRSGVAAQEKTKYFEPTKMGFRMPTHQPSSNSRIYQYLGGTPTTEIEFLLPGLRLETICNAKNKFVGLTAITPGAKNSSIITHMLYWDLPILTILKPMVDAMASSFLGQDGVILNAQAVNLNRTTHRPLYAGDPDKPAQMYQTINKAWESRARDVAFVNPLEKIELHWRT